MESYCICQRSYHSVDLIRHRVLAHLSDKIMEALICFEKFSDRIILILNSGFRDVKQYTQKKEIEIQLAFENSIISVRQDTLFESCKTAKALYLRTALFPLYPRLHRSQVEKITKVLGTLP